MAKRLILAVAGSGKTYEILKKIDCESRSLIITYTHENYRSLDAGLKEKFGYIPANVTLMTYFSFLYRHCIQPFFSYRLRDQSYTWVKPPTKPRWAYDHIRHYLTPARYIYSNRAAKLPLQFAAMKSIRARLERHFDQFFVDEVQDFASNDFNFLLELTKANLEFMLVGDFFQHTFDTSRDGQIRVNLHKRGIEAYLNEFRAVGVEVDLKSLDKTHRCSPAVCKFITDVIGIPISSHRTDDTRVIRIQDENEALALARDPTKVTLFYENYRKYECNANNWGNCKGLNSYDDVCVALNPNTFKALEDCKIHELPDLTKNKLYVACSRARGNLYLMNERLLRKLRQD